MAGPEPEVDVVWEEQLWYREGADAFCFDCSWSAAPYVVYIPSPRIWDDVMPPFLRGRRDEIIANLRAANDRHGHLLEDTEVGYDRWRADPTPRRRRRGR